MYEKQVYISPAKKLRRQVREVVNDPEAYYRQKPEGGLWTSSWREDSQDSAWVEWCLDNSYGDVEYDNWWLLTPQPDCRLYTINSLKDFHRCLRDYGYPAPIAADHPLLAEKRVIDFERLAQEFDGVHLTGKGNAATHLSSPNDLNGWDCESTLWFYWRFTKVVLLDKGPVKEKVSS